MATTFLFWNTKGNQVQGIIAKLAVRHDVDVIMLAECSIDQSVLIETLNATETIYEYVPQTGCFMIEIFTKFSADYIPPRAEGKRYTLRQLTLPGCDDILLAVAHLSSKLHRTGVDQVAACLDLAVEIRSIEEDLGHSRTVLVGDLNANPFDPGVTAAMGLHGVMTKEIAGRGSRTVDGRKYPYFYNPMWSLLGDQSPGPPGTYYYHGSGQRAFFWHAFDQVLVRPELFGRFRNTDLQVLDSDGNTSFLNPKSGIPLKKSISDHLPLLFKLDLDVPRRR